MSQFIHNPQSPLQESKTLKMNQTLLMEYTLILINMNLMNHSELQNPLLHRLYLDLDEESDHTWTTNRLPGRWKLLGDAHNRQYHRGYYV